MRLRKLNEESPGISLVPLTEHSRLVGFNDGFKKFPPWFDVVAKDLTDGRRVDIHLGMIECDRRCCWCSRQRRWHSATSPVTCLHHQQSHTSPPSVKDSELHEET